MANHILKKDEASEADRLTDEDIKAINALSRMRLLESVSLLALRLLCLVTMISSGR